jgi:DNA-binding NarL/FixJ family response regulator
MPAAQRMDCSVHVTPREAEVLDLLALGFGDAEIGETMGLATRTVASERHPHPEGSQSRVREAAMKVS